MQALFVLNRVLSFFQDVNAGAAWVERWSARDTGGKLPPEPPGRCRTTLGQWDGEEQVKDVGRLAAWREREESALTHRFLAWETGLLVTPFRWGRRDEARASCKQIRH